MSDSTANTLQGEDTQGETIVRIHKRNNPYVMVDRATAQDEQLTWEARGLLVYLLSLPANWTINVRHLQKQGGAGRDAVRRILRELQSYGYVSGFGEAPQQANGRFAPEIAVYESPTLNPYFMAEDPPATEKPSPVKQVANTPATAFPATAFPATANTSAYTRKSEQSKDLDKTHTYTEQRAPRGVSGSRFSFEECRRYAEHLRASGEGINNPGGYATNIHRSGEVDAFIERFLGGDLSGGVTVVASQCPDCDSAGFTHESVLAGAVVKCKHPKLSQVSRGASAA